MRGLSGIGAEYEIAQNISFDNIIKLYVNNRILNGVETQKLQLE